MHCLVGVVQASCELLVIHCLLALLKDVTRVIVLDESQTGAVGETVARLIKDISHEQAATQFSVSVMVSYRMFVKGMGCLNMMSGVLLVETRSTCPD